MKTETFWMIVLRIVGLMLLSSAFYVIPQALLTLRQFNDSSSPDRWEAALYLLAGIIVYLVITYFFLFRPDRLVRGLRLCNRMEAEIGLSITPSTFLSVSVAVTGGLMFARGLPSLVSELIRFFQVHDLLRDYPSLHTMVATAVQVLVGFLLLSRCHTVAHYILSKANPSS